MRSVGIKELKNKLSAYVRIAASGERIVVTERGHAVAELVPSRSQGAMTPDEKWADLVRRGIVTPATDKSGTPPPKPPPVATWSELAEELARDREDR
jgi:prevent-host-death family protein